MKRKFFIIFILITLFLIACFQNEKKPVDNASSQRKSEEEERQERIATIKKNGIPSAVIEVLKEHNNENWSADINHPGYFRAISVVFDKVPYKVVGGTEFSYNDTKSSDRAKESKAARREVYLALNYFFGSIRAFGEFIEKLVETRDLVTKNKAALKDFFKKMRDCAKAYYLDAYDTLEKKLGNLEVLSAAELKSLHDNLDLLKAERDKLVSKILQPLKDKYPIIGECLADPGSKTIVNILTADEIETYWNTLSAEFNSICDEIMRISGEIKGILDNIKVKG
ncbi:virulence associated lipoprotein (plasmid) [Borrelia recurrentis]|uniref:virulence associated lipoprotein n=1 Tax=Borrelia recurrentis TaxID=44449 RepID=UPI0036725CA0